MEPGVAVALDLRSRAAAIALAFGMALVAGCGDAGPSRTVALHSEAPAALASASPAAPSRTSDPEHDWQPVPDQEAVRGVQLLDVAWTGSRFIAVGSGLDGNDAVVDTRDGLVWHRQPAMPGEQHSDVAAGSTGVVMIGTIDGRPSSWYSPDGLAWTASPNAFEATAQGTDTILVTDVVATPGGWLAVGREDPACNVNCGLEPVRSIAWTSPDGLAWQVVPDQESLVGGGMNAVAAYDGGYVAAGVSARHAAIWTSPDGRAWSRVPDAAAFGPRPGAGTMTDTAAHGVASNDGVVVVAGADTNDGYGVRAWRSTDGVTWTSATGRTFEDGWGTSIAAVSTAFLITGGMDASTCHAGMWESADGRTWRCAATDAALDGFGPQAVASSPAIDLVVGLTTVGYNENSSNGVPGAAWWRSATSEAPAALASASPSPMPEPTVTPPPGRPPLYVGAGAGGDVMVTGGLQGDGSYRVMSGTTYAAVVGSIPDIEGRIPDPWTLVDNAWATPQLSDTDFLALDLTSGPQGDENAAVGVFDLLAPTADPLVIPSNGGGSRMAGDRLWVAMADNEFSVYDLPSATHSLVSLGADTDVPSPFYLSAAGDAVLVRVGGPDGELRMVDMAGAQRAVLPDESLLGPIGVERLFGPDGAELRSGPCNDSASPSSDLCVLDASGTGTGYDVPGQLIDVAWDPGERIPVWVSTKGVGIIRDGTTRTIVKLGAWQPVRIAGFWSNAVILASGASPRLAFAVTGPDAITKLPMPPNSIVALPGDVLLRVVPGEDVPD